MKSKRVEIYRNLHKKGIVYSIREQSSGLVIGHTSNLYLKDVRFKVSQSGRNRVLKEKRKNVHAVIQGTITSGGTSRKGRLITYNPYTSNQFFLKNNPSVKVYFAEQVNITKGKIKGTGLIFINDD
jgi:hypothetical protein